MKFRNYIFIFKILPVISFILLLQILPMESKNSFFTYNETPIENAGRPIIFDIQSFNDDKIVVHIVHVNLPVTAEANKPCVDVVKDLSLRTIYPDGKV